MSTLEDGLLLQHVTGFEFSGVVDGCGFLVRILDDGSDEGWILVRHYGHPWVDVIRSLTGKGVAHDMPPEILVEDERAGVTGRYWVPWNPTEGHGEFHPIRFDDVRSGVQMALSICAGRLRPREARVLKRRALTEPELAIVAAAEAAPNPVSVQALGVEGYHTALLNEMAEKIEQAVSESKVPYEKVDFGPPPHGPAPDSTDCEDH
jgi:hypothetical protein